MNGMVELLSTPTAQRVGWALLHFLWQGTVVALLLAVLLQLLRRRSPQARWAVSCLALAAMAALPAVTACMVSVNLPEAAPIVETSTARHASEAAVVGMAPPPSPVLPPVSSPPVEDPTPVEMGSSSGPPAGAADQRPPEPWLQRAGDILHPFLPWAIVAWLVGVTGMSLWHVGGWLQVRRLRHSGAPPADSAIRDAFGRLLQRLRVRRPVRLVESVRVAVPVVVGWLRPVVLLPASALSGLSPTQLEAVLAHELAHVRRWDCLVRLLQAVVETLLFYHPAVWWVSRRIREESENCCDDIAAEVCGDRKGYADALAEMASMGNGVRGVAAAATGGKLLPRIRRIVGLAESRSQGKASWLSAAILVAALAMTGMIVVGYLAAGQTSTGNGKGEAEDAAALDIRLVGIQPDGSDDILDVSGRKVGQMFAVGGHGFWGPEKQRRAFIFEVPKTDQRFLPERFFRVRSPREKRFLSSSQGSRLVEHQGKRLLLCRLTIDRSFKEKRFLITRTIPIEEVDLTLRYYHGPPRESEFSFTGPFTPGTTVRADGGKPCTLALKQDYPHDPSARFHLSAKVPRRHDSGMLVYDTAGRRHLGDSGSGSKGPRGEEKDFTVHGVPLRRIAKIVFGEKPHEKTFPNVPLRFPGRPVRDCPEFLEKMSKALGRPAKDTNDHSVKTLDEAIKVADIARGNHIQRVHGQFISAKFAALPPEQQTKLREVALSWAKAPYPSTRVLGVELGMRWGGGSEFAAAALALLDSEDKNVRRQAAGSLTAGGRYLSPQQVRQVKQRVLARDDPAVSNYLVRCLQYHRTPASTEALWELARADDDRPWLWWPALGSLETRGEIRHRPSLPKKLRLRLILARGVRQSEQHLAGEAYGLLPGLLTPRFRRMNTSLFGDIYRLLRKHVDRPRATKAMVEFLRGLDCDARPDCAISYVVKRLNLWYGVNLGKLGWDVRTELPPAPMRNPQAIVAEVLKWYQAGKLEPPGRAAPAEGTFAPIVDRTINTAETRKDCFIDFDADVLASPPDDLAVVNLPRDQREKLERWCRQNGIDALCHAYTGGGSLKTFDVVASPVPVQFWQTAGAEAIGEALGLAARDQSYAGTNAFDEALPATFAFKTAKGGAGLLQILAVTDNPRGLSIRYKLLRGPTAGGRAVSRPRVERARRHAAQATVASLKVALDTFEIDVMRYPTTEEGLSALVRQPKGVKEWKGPYIRRMITDPWGRPYVYRCPGRRNPQGYDVYSVGPDGKDGGGDDIGNWSASTPPAPTGGGTTGASTQPAEESARALEARIKRLIDQIGSKRHSEREAAQNELVKIGSPAIPALRATVAGKDPERANRARLALKRIEGAIAREAMRQTAGQFSAIFQDWAKPAEESARALEARIKRLIDQIGSQKYSEREAAQNELVKLGLPAVEALQAATKDTSKERAGRAKAVLAQLALRKENWPLSWRGMTCSFRLLSSDPAKCMALGIDENRRALLIMWSPATKSFVRSESTLSPEDMDILFRALVRLKPWEPNTGPAWPAAEGSGTLELTVPAVGQFARKFARIERPWPTHAARVSGLARVQRAVLHLAQVIMKQAAIRAQAPGAGMVGMAPTPTIAEAGRPAGRRASSTRPGQPPPTGKLYGEAYSAALKASGAADLARAEYEKTYDGGGARSPANKGDPSTPVAQEAFAKVERLFKEAIDKAGMTDIGVYTRRRLAGAYRYHGQKERAAAMNKEAQELKLAVEKLKWQHRLRREGADWPELAGLMRLLHRPGSDKIAPGELADAWGKLRARSDEAVGRLMEEFWPPADYAYRWRTITALGVLNSPRSRQALLELALCAKKDGLPWVRGAARQYVEALPDKSEARKLLTSSDTVVLQNAAVGLRGIRLQKDTIDRLVPLMQSKDTHLRFLIVGVLGDDPSGKLASVKIAAIVRAIPDIPGMKKANDIWWPGSWTHAEAFYRTYVHALAKVKNGKKSLMGELARAKAGGPVWRSLVLARGFGGDAGVCPEVRKILTDPKAGMFRAWAAEALSKIGTSDDLLLLRKVAEKDPMRRERGGCMAPLNKQLYHPVRQAAQQAIKTLQAGPGKPGTTRPATQPTARPATRPAGALDSLAILIGAIKSRWDTALTVNGDGTYSYKLVRGGQTGYTTEHHLKPADLDKLTKLLAATRWLSAPGRVQRHLKDGEDFHLAVIRDGRETKTRCYGPQGKAYGELVQFIRWISRQEMMLQRMKTGWKDGAFFVYSLDGQLAALLGKGAPTIGSGPLPDYTRFLETLEVLAASSNPARRALAQRVADKIRRYVATLPATTRPGTPRTRPAGAATEKENIAWGKAVRGVQLGLAFGLKNRPVRVGELVGFKVWVRNTGAKEVRLVDFVAGDPYADRAALIGWSPTVRDPAGKTLLVAGSRRPIMHKRVRSLSAGQGTLVGTVFLKIDARPQDRSSHPHLQLRPGKYRVSQTYRFRRGEGAWSGELSTGQLTLIVVRSQPAPTGASTQPAVARRRTLREILAGRGKPDLEKLAARVAPDSTRALKSEDFYDLLKLREVGDEKAIPVLAKIVAVDADRGSIFGHSALQALYCIGGKRAKAVLGKYLLKDFRYSANRAYVYAFGWDMSEPQRSGFIRDYLLKAIPGKLAVQLEAAPAADGQSVTFTMRLRNVSADVLQVREPQVYLGRHVYLRTDQGPYLKSVETIEYGIPMPRWLTLKPKESRDFIFKAKRAEATGRDGRKQIVLRSRDYQWFLSQPGPLTAVAMFEQPPLSDAARKALKVESPWIGRAVSKPVSFRVALPAPAAPSPNGASTQPGGRHVRRLSPVLQKERDKLLAQADAEIRKGLLKLAEDYPQLKKPKYWRNINLPSRPGHISIWLRHTDKGKAATADQVPARERVVVAVYLRKPPDGPSQQGWMLYPGLGLFGQLTAGAGDPKLDAALKKLVGDAIAPLERLERQVSAPDVRPSSRQATQPAGAPEALQARISELITQLGSTKYAEREAAQKELAKIGPPAVAALREAASQDDAEVASRAQRALTRIERAPVERAVNRFLKAMADADVPAMTRMMTDDSPLWLKRSVIERAKKLREKGYAAGGERPAITEVRFKADLAAVRAEGPKALAGRYLWLILRRVDTRWLVYQLGDSDPKSPLSGWLDQTARHTGFKEYTKATQALLEGESRAAAAKRFASIAERYPQSIRAKESAELAQFLRQMAAADKRFHEPKDPAGLPAQERIRYLVFKLRDVAAREFTVPGRCNTLRDAKTKDTAAHLLRKMGKSAVPTLMGLLGDRRPTRSSSDCMNGGQVLRYCDVALQILEAIAVRRFDRQTRRGSCLSTADEQTRKEIIGRVKSWWQANRSKTESQWIRESLSKSGIGAMWDRLASAERLIELDGANSVDFFRERLRAEPTNVHTIRVLWKAGGEAVLEDIRAKTSSKSPAMRASAYRVLARAGVDGTVEAVLKEIEAIEGMTGASASQQRDYVSSFVCALAHSGRSEAVLAAARLIEHDDPKVGYQAFRQVMYAHRAKEGLAPATAKMLMPYVASALQNEKFSTDARCWAANWMVRTAKLSIPSPEASTPAIRKATVAAVSGWWAKHKDEYPKAAKPAPGGSAPADKTPATQPAGKESAVSRSDTGPTFRVVDATGKGVAGATIRFSGERKMVGPDGKTTWQFQYRFSTARADATGRFKAPEIEPGRLIVANLTAPGFVMREHVAIGRLKEGTYWPDDRAIQLHRECTLEGRVVGPDGKPLAAAPLSLSTSVRYPNRGILTGNHLRAITGKTGRFVFTGVPPGDHLLVYPWIGPTKAEVASGRWKAFAKPAQRYPSPPVRGVCGVKPLRLRDGEKRARTILDLSKSTCRVEGVVRDVAGSPVAGANVGLLWVYEGGWSPVVHSRNFPEARTDAQGRYQLTGLPPGRRHLRAWHRHAKKGGRPVAVELTPGRTVRQNLSLPERIKVAATVGRRTPPAPRGASTRPAAEATDDYSRAVARLKRAVPHGQPTQLHKLLGELHSQNRRPPNERELGVIRSLIADGKDIDARDRQGRTALHWAAWDAQPDVVRLLLAKGADANAMADAGRTPLHFAAEATNDMQQIRKRVPEVVQLLLKAGADPFADIWPGRLAGGRPTAMVNPTGRNLTNVVRELQGGTTTPAEIVEVLRLLWTAMEPGRKAAIAEARPVAQAFLRSVAKSDADGVAKATWDQDIELTGQQKKNWKQVSDVILKRYAGKIERLTTIQEEQIDRGMAAFRIAPPEGDDRWLLVVVGRFSDGVWRVVMAEEKQKEMTLLQPLGHLVGTCSRRLLLQQSPATRPAAKGSAEEQLQRLWVALGSAEATEADTAVKAMVALGDRAVAFLAGRFYPPPADAGRVKQLIAKLDDAKHAVRKKAYDELMQLGRAALPALKEALKQPKLSVEARTRIEGVVKNWTGEAQARRFDGAVRVVTRIWSPQARALFDRLARKALLWGLPNDGLRARWLPLKRPVRAGEAPRVSVELENVSGKTIYFECISEITWHLPIRGSKDPRATRLIVRFTTRPGKGVRAATKEEARRNVGWTHPRFLAGTLDGPGYFRMEPAGRMTLTCEYPWLLVEPGEKKITGYLQRRSPGGRKGLVGRNQVDPNLIVFPPLAVKVVEGAPDAKHAYDVAWGKAADGLQAGVRYEFGRRPVAHGGGVTLPVCLRNVSGKPIRVTYSQTSHRDDPPVVRDAAGRKQRLQPGRGKSWPLVTITVKAGQAISLDYAGFMVLPANHKGPSGRRHVLYADPGRYMVTKLFRFNTDGGKTLNKQLTAGPIQVVVVRTQPPTPPAARARRRPPSR